jgi:pilus assembly protein Flp/PilA
MRHPKQIMSDQKAATAVEYGLILALIVLTMMVALVSLAGTTTRMWNDIGNKVSTCVKRLETSHP